MYSTCLYCSKNLGSNEVIETLPIGRRIAFDAREGRLWVVCRGCEKWNLVPFDTRLETIDRCEQLFADARLRFSTDNIGIARLAEGLELVRIGSAQRPEFAAWRYGDQFGRRRIVNGLKIGGFTAATIGLTVGHHLLLPVLGGGFGFQFFNFGYNAYNRRKAVVRIPEQEGVGGVMTPQAIKTARIITNTDTGKRWSLMMSVYKSSRAGFAAGWSSSEVEFEGDRAIDVLGRVLPRVNAGGGSARRVREAVDVLESRPHVLDLLRIRQNFDCFQSHRPVRLDIGMAARLATNRPPPRVIARPVEQEWLRSSYRLSELPPTARLALEMLAHEDSERAALAGQLKLLEREWKAADELARIADSLAVTDDVHTAVDQPEG